MVTLAIFIICWIYFYSIFAIYVETECNTGKFKDHIALFIFSPSIFCLGIIAFLFDLLDCAKKR